MASFWGRLATPTVGGGGPRDRSGSRSASRPSTTTAKPTRPTIGGHCNRHHPPSEGPRRVAVHRAGFAKRWYCSPLGHRLSTAAHATPQPFGRPGIHGAHRPRSSCSWSGTSCRLPDLQSTIAIDRSSPCRDSATRDGSPSELDIRKPRSSPRVAPSHMPARGPIDHPSCFGLPHSSTISFRIV